jgi:hypothetical protein
MEVNHLAIPWNPLGLTVGNRYRITLPRNEVVYVHLERMHRLYDSYRHIDPERHEGATNIDIPHWLGDYDFYVDPPPFQQVSLASKYYRLMNYEIPPLINYHGQMVAMFDSHHVPREVEWRLYFGRQHAEMVRIEDVTGMPIPAGVSGVGGRRARRRSLRSLRSRRSRRARRSRKTH